MCIERIFIKTYGLFFANNVPTRQIIAQKYKLSIEVHLLSKMEQLEPVTGRNGRYGRARDSGSKAALWRVPNPRSHY